jgi:hypothetical protein
MTLTFANFKVFRTPEVTRVYISSFWDRAYAEIGRCYRMCSLTECVLLQNVFSYYRMCSLTRLGGAALFQKTKFCHFVFLRIMCTFHQK